MSFVPGPVDHVICPYNKSHVIRKERIQFHLTKCLPNAGDKKFVICPFNSTHLIPSSEINNHKTNLCPDRINLDTFLFDVVGSKPLFKVNKIELESEENWDNDVKFSYDPEKVMREKKLLVLKQCVPPAERKRFNAEQRKKFQTFPDDELISVSKNNKSKIRPPNSKSMALKVPAEKTDAEDVDIVEKKMNNINIDEKKPATDEFELVVGKKKNKKTNKNVAVKTNNDQTMKNEQRAVKQQPNKNLKITNEKPKNEASKENIAVEAIKENVATKQKEDVAVEQKEDEFIVVTKKRNKSRKN